VSGEFELDRPRNLEMLVFNLRLGRLRLCAMVLLLFGAAARASSFWLVMSMCVGTSSGSRFVNDRWISVLPPGMPTPPTWRASNGLDIVTAFGRVMVGGRCDEGVRLSGTAYYVDCGM
jgi:hypothetical protein